MKSIRLSLFAVLLFAAAAVQAAGLTVSEMEVDYGSVKEGPAIVKKIVLTNGGAETLKIANVATS
jgi:hypothetical protein